MSPLFAPAPLGRKVHVLVVGALCLIANACGQGPRADAIAKIAASRATQFSAEDRRAAQALSIDMRKDLTNYSSDYIKNLVCEVSLAKMGELLGEMSALSPPQKAALDQARTNYSRRVTAAAKVEGKTTEDIGIDRKAQQESALDRSVQLQSGMACLRALVETGTTS